MYQDGRKAIFNADSSDDRRHTIIDFTKIQWYLSRTHEIQYQKSRLFERISRSIILETQTCQVMALLQVHRKDLLYNLHTTSKTTVTIDCLDSSGVYDSTSNFTPDFREYVLEMGIDANHSCFLCTQQLSIKSLLQSIYTKLSVFILQHQLPQKKLN